MVELLKESNCGTVTCDNCHGLMATGHCRALVGGIVVGLDGSDNPLRHPGCLAAERVASDLRAGIAAAKERADVRLRLLKVANQCIVGYDALFQDITTEIESSDAENADIKTQRG